MKNIVFDIKETLDALWKIENKIGKLPWSKRSNKLDLVEYHLKLARNLLEEAMDEQKK